MMNITLINPNIVTQKGDFFGTGIPYMPIVLAYLASYLRDKGHTINVIDGFGENPFKKRVEEEFIISGLSEEGIVSRVNGLPDLICLYAGHVVEHFIILRTLKSLKNKFPKVPVCMVENAQAVTAYSLKISHKDFFQSGADFVVFGEPEKTVEELITKLKSKEYLNKKYMNISGLICKDKTKISQKKEPIDDIDSLPFPAWDLFPIENYWKLGYSHAPFQGRYITLLTSRGCPYMCEFCIIPFTNERMWRARSAKNVVDEILHWNKKYDVRDFHIEDLNPTINKERIKLICRLIIDKNLKITLKFASGVKLETLDKETIELLAKAGCNYISFSPESGSKRVLKLMNKPFDHKHGIEMSEFMDKLGIKMQACFVIGFPGETDEDRQLTGKYIKKLTKAGVDEIALFIMTPIPGSRPYEYSQQKPEELSKLTFSPKWRKGYGKLHRYRRNIYILFLFYKLIYHPIKTLKQPFRFISGRFDVKMEMTLYRMFKTYFL